MPDDEAWKKRVNTVSAAQSKYLWTLLALGVFYWAAMPAVDASGKAPAALYLPVLNLPLPASAILATAPAVLFFLQLVIFGTMRAFDTADQALKPGGANESLDHHSNAIDWAVYTSDKSPKLATKIAGLSYPLYMIVFTAEATYFLWALMLTPLPVPHRWYFVPIALLEGVFVYLFLVRFCIGRVRRIFSASNLYEEIEEKVLKR